MKKWLKKKKLIKFFDKYQNTLQGLVAAVLIIGALFGGMSWVFSSPEIPPSTPMITMTLEQYEDLLKAKIEEAILERDSAEADRRTLLNRKIASLQDRLVNSEQTFEEQKEIISNLQEALVAAAPLLDADAISQANDALARGDASLAEELFKDIKTQAEAIVQASVRASFALGEIAEQDYRWQEAFAYYSEAARLDRNYAHLIRAQKAAFQVANYPEAESFANAALRAADQEFGKESPEYGAALNNLAVLLKATGRLEGAELLYRQAVDIIRVALGEKHIDFGIALHNLAELLRERMRYEEAEPLFRQAVNIARVALGEKHSGYGTLLNNFAKLLQDMQRFDEAEPLFRQSVEIYRAALGEAHPYFGRSLNNLAKLLLDTERYEKAEPLFRQALDITRAALGEAHPNYGKNLGNLAALLEATARYEEAEPLYRQAVRVLERSLGPDHPSTKTIKANFESFLANHPPAD